MSKIMILKLYKVKLKVGMAKKDLKLYKAEIKI